MIGTATLRAALEEAGIDYGRLGNYRTQWRDERGVSWSATEDVGGKIWLRSGPIDAGKAIEVAVGVTER